MGIFNDGPLLTFSGCGVCKGDSLPLVQFWRDFFDRFLFPQQATMGVSLARCSTRQAASGSRLRGPVSGEEHVGGMDSWRTEYKKAGWTQELYDLSPSLRYPKAQHAVTLVEGLQAYTI